MPLPFAFSGVEVSQHGAATLRVTVTSRGSDTIELRASDERAARSWP